MSGSVYSETILFYKSSSHMEKLVHVLTISSNKAILTTAATHNTNSRTTVLGGLSSHRLRPFYQKGGQILENS